MKYKFENVRAIRDAAISPRDIVLIKADLNYSVFHLVNGKKITLAKTLMQCEQMLENHSFVRPSRSFLINTDFLKSVGENELTLLNGIKTPVSRRRKNVFNELSQN